MQSPKFKFLRPELEGVFSRNLLKEEWKKRVGYQIRKQLIFDLIEYRDYKDSIEIHIDQILHDIMSGMFQVRVSKRYLSEKSKGLCRQMTLIHPLDLLVLERLSRSFYLDLKSKCPSKSAFFEPDDGSFIKGFQQVDFQYGSFASWKKFQKKIFGFSDENKFIVVTDVANFYDFINFQQLRNIISSIASIKESVLDLLIYILNRLTWTPDFMPLSQVGMPQIETTATRVLANAMLYEVDRVCEDSAALNYARFMDDMDIGVDDIPNAKKIVRDIDLTLQSRQLRLNSSKTKILSSDEALDHFCVFENHILARYERFLKNKRWSPTIKKILIKRYSKWASTNKLGEIGIKSPFLKANGSKIHKYILRLVYDSGEVVPEADLLWLIRNDPGMRGTALRYLSYSKINNSNLSSLSEIIEKRIFVDGAAIVDLTSYLLHARFRFTKLAIQRIRKMVRTFERHSDIGIYCAILLSARFLYTAEILSMLRRNVKIIRSDFWLSRATAGIMPVFLKNPHHHHLFLHFVRSLKNEDAERVLEFLMNLVECDTINVSQKRYFESRNDSYVQKIYFPKVMQLLAISKNKNVSKIFPNMYVIHPALRSDPFYKKMGFS